MRAQAPWRRGERWPEFDLLIAVIERARADLEGKDLSREPLARRAEIMAEARSFLSELETATGIQQKRDLVDMWSDRK